MQDLNNIENTVADLTEVEAIFPSEQLLNRNILKEVVEAESLSSANRNFIGSNIVTGDDNTGLLNQDIDLDAGNLIQYSLLVNGGGSNNRAIVNRGDSGEGQQIVINTGAIRGTNIVTGSGNNNIGIDNYETSIATGEGRDRVLGIVSIEGDGNGNRSISNTFSTIDLEGNNDRIKGITSIAGNGDSNSGSTGGFFGYVLGNGNDKFDAILKITGDGDRNSGFSGGDGAIVGDAGNDTVKTTVSIGGDGNDNDGISLSEAGIILGDGSDRLNATVRIDGDGSNNSGIFLIFGSVSADSGNNLINSTVEIRGSGDYNRGLELDFFGDILGGTEADRLVSSVRVRSGSNNIGSYVGDFGNINLGDGNDRLISSTEIVGAGDNNSGIVLAAEQGSAGIDTGAGNDLIRSSVSVSNGINNYAIDNRQTIELGTGNDSIEAEAPDVFSGYTGGGTINLGAGDDLINGFGEQFIDGGEGFDVAQFGFKDFSVTLGSEPNSLEIVANDITMSFSGVEQFDFVVNSYSFDELAALV